MSNNITKGCTYLILCNKHEHGSAQVQNTDDFSNSVIKKSVFLILEGKTNTNISNLEGNIFFKKIVEEQNIWKKLCCICTNNICNTCLTE